MKRMNILGVLFMACASIIGYYHYPISAATEITPKHPQELTVVFDLGGVVLSPSKLSALWQLGPKNVVFSLLRHRSIQPVREKFYTVLNKVYGSNGNSLGVGDGHGRSVPAILAEWVRGDHPNKQILDTVCTEIEKHPEWFSDKREQKIITAITQFTFDPVKFSKVSKPIPEMVEFIEECKAKGYKVSVLSNWDAESFDLLAAKYPGIFGLFDYMIISGKVHEVKPCQAIYSLVTDKTPAHQCVFIDDQPVNITAARKAGMHGIVATPKKMSATKSPDMKLLREEFAKLEDRLGSIEKRAYPMYSAIDTVEK